MQVKLKKEDFQAMAAHAVAHLPEEACGLIAGEKSDTERVSALIYPEYIKCDINEEIHKFFDLFYHVDLSDEQLENVLKGTL